MNTYAVSLIVENEHHLAHRLFIYKGEDEHSVRRKAMEDALYSLPETEGWHNHQLKIVEVYSEEQHD